MAGTRVRYTPPGLLRDRQLPVHDRATAKRRTATATVTIRSTRSTTRPPPPTTARRRRSPSPRTPARRRSNVLANDTAPRTPASRSRSSPVDAGRGRRRRDHRRRQRPDLRPDRRVHCRRHVHVHDQRRAPRGHRDGPRQRRPRHHAAGDVHPRRRTPPRRRRASGSPSVVGSRAPVGRHALPAPAADRRRRRGRRSRCLRRRRRPIERVLAGGHDYAFRVRARGRNRQPRRLRDVRAAAPLTRSRPRSVARRPALATAGPSAILPPPCQVAHDRARTNRCLSRLVL